MLTNEKNDRLQEIQNLQAELLQYGAYTGSCFETSLNLHNLAIAALLCEGELTPEDRCGILLALNMSKTFINMAYSRHLSEK